MNSMDMSDRTITERELIDAVSALGLDAATDKTDLELADQIVSKVEEQRAQKVS
jgi:hypothetical protein